MSLNCVFRDGEWKCQVSLRLFQLSSERTDNNFWQIQMSWDCKLIECTLEVVLGL